MNLVYICSPYRATDAETLQRNVEYAKALTRTILLRGECPVTPHLYMTQCLDESSEDERSIGLTAGMEVLRRCSRIVVGIQYGVSEGMIAEIQCAQDGGLAIEYIERVCGNDG